MTADAVVLLSLLCNYNKYESTNPYLVWLSGCTDEEFMMASRRENAAVGTLHSVASYIGGLLWSTEEKPNDTINEQSLHLQTTFFLFYDLIYTNKKFKALLSSQELTLPATTYYDIDLGSSPTQSPTSVSPTSPISATSSSPSSALGAVGGSPAAPSIASSTLRRLSVTFTRTSSTQDQTITGPEDLGERKAWGTTSLIDIKKSM
ncbi:hypothetical protein HK102_010926 [Quaeritorhiza haematococci]|nr:hypothetical protein HK102_010926 [Quaeritorhiza haematococci]